jgi:hypothetical protein
MKFYTLFLSCTLVLASRLVAQGQQPLTRDEIVRLAKSMADTVWTPSVANVKPTSCGGKTNGYIAGHPYQGIPYLLGGLDGISTKNGANEFLRKLGPPSNKPVLSEDLGNQGKCATGIDCAGFVIRSWGVDVSGINVSGLWTYAVRTTREALKSGDAISLAAGSHVVLVDRVGPQIVPKTKWKVVEICEAHKHGLRADCGRILDPVRFTTQADYLDHMAVMLTPPPQIRTDNSRKPSRPVRPHNSSTTRISPEVLSFSQPVLDFGPVEADSLSVRSVKLFYEGSSDAVFSSSVSQTSFELEASKSEIRVPSHSSITLTVRFKSSSAGDFRGELTVFSKEGTITAHLPLAARAITHCLSLAGNIPITFGLVNARSRVTLTRKATLVNCGSERVTVERLEITGDPRWVYAIEPFVPFRLDEAESKEVEIVLKGAADGLFSGTLNILTDATRKPHPIAVTATGASACLEQPQPVHLGQRSSGDPGNSVELPLRSCSDIAVEGVSLSADQPFFEVASAPKRILGNQSSSAVLSLRADSPPGVKESSVTIRADDLPDMVVSVRVEGRQCLDAAPRSVSYEPQRVSRRVKSETVVVKNGCSSALELSASLIGATESFSLDGNPKKALRLKPGESGQFQVRYKAQRANHSSAIVAIEISNGSHLDIPVTAEASRNNWFVAFMRWLRILD